MKNEQIELMQHALGINERQREPYRNYFLASGGNAANPDWQELVTAGYATSSPAPAWTCGDITYHVTDAGKAIAIAALPAPKKATRYDEYLRSEVCESFSEWLGIQLPEYECRAVGRSGKYEYRMFRHSRCYWDPYRDVVGEWRASKKEAKASYRQELKAFKARHRTERTA